MNTGNHRPAVTIYQGEPLTTTIADKIDDVYVEDLSSYQLEALMRDAGSTVIKKWSSRQGTISFDQVPAGDTVKGVAYFGLRGDETAPMKPGYYTLEMARVFPDGRAIEILTEVICVKAAAIREGV
ncbi:MAG: hypothetical protein MJY60_04225 [Bacteroidales bacterium]|nr:hypothetical protein [Bacteroidales bacterium]